MYKLYYNDNDNDNDMTMTLQLTYSVGIAGRMLGMGLAVEFFARPPHAWHAHGNSGNSVCVGVLIDVILPVSADRIRLSEIHARVVPFI